MASKQFLNALQGLNGENGTKNLDSVLLGSDYLPEGVHDVTIQSVDTADIDSNRVQFVFADASGKTYRDNVFLTNKDGSQLSMDIRRLLSATIPDTELMGKFLEIAATDEQAFEMFTGLRLRITIKPGPGFQIRSTSDGKFAAFDVDKTGAVTEQITAEFDDIKEAKLAAKDAGFKQSYLRIVKAEATHVEANRQAFNAALASRQKSAGTSGANVSNLGRRANGAPRV